MIDVEKVYSCEIGQETLVQMQPKYKIMYLEYHCPWLGKQPSGCVIKIALSGGAVIIMQDLLNGQLFTDCRIFSTH